MLPSPPLQFSHQQCSSSCVDSLKFSEKEEQTHKRKKKKESWSWHCLSCSVALASLSRPFFPPQQIVYDSHSVTMIFQHSKGGFFLSLAIVCAASTWKERKFVGEKKEKLRSFPLHLIASLPCRFVHTTVINKMILVDENGGGTLRLEEIMFIIQT